MGTPLVQPADDPAFRARTRRFVLLGVLLLVLTTPLRLGLTILDGVLGFPIFGYLVSPVFDGVGTALLAAGFVGLLLRRGA